MAVTWCTAAAFQPIEAFEYMLKLLRRNTRSVVRNRQNGFAILLIEVDDHNSTFPPMFYGIVDDIRYGVEQEVTISANTDSPCHREPQPARLCPLRSRQIVLPPRLRFH